jgi:adenylate cyclase
MHWTRESKRFITVGILSALLSFAAVNLTPLYWLSERVTDGLLRKFRQVSHPDLTLVVIDDESLRALGRFPFDRTVYARMLDRLKAAGAKVVAFDILFVEPTPSDKILAEAMRRFGKVILGVNLSLKSEGKVPRRFLLSLDFPLPLKVAGVTLPPEPLLSACYSLGFVYPFPDRDGVCRSLPLAVELTEAGGVIPSLSLAAVMAFLGEPQMSPNSIRWRNRVIQLGSDWDIPVLPPFSPERVGFPSVSLVKVLEGEFDPELVRGKLVLVGMGASGLSDRLPTSTDPLAYGVEIHGAAINALLTGKFPKHIPFWLQILIALAFCIPASGSLLLPRFHQSLLVFVGLTLAAYILALLLLRWGFVLALMPLLLSLVMAFVVATGLLLEIQRFALERIRAYVAQPVTEVIASPHEMLRMGERREITILFSDIRNFTQIAATLPPYEVVGLLESYFNRMTEIVRIYGGVVDKFLGDGMMVLFGVSFGQNDHAQRAVLCAWQMLEELSAVNWEWERVTGSPLRIGIGINTGIAIIGEIGAEWRKELTALGAAVNLAQRLEQLTKDLGAALLIGENTYYKVADLVVAEPLEPMTVKGFDQPIVAYKVTGLTELGQQIRKSILATGV